ncbi:MAG: hypothetical protein CMJ97_08015 [Planctomycetes bacterium]|nr:hypothetical protein [Planctomycetota bacterium]
MRQNITVAMLAICATLLAVNVVQQMNRPAFMPAFGQAVGNTQGNYVLATGMSQSGNANMLFVLEVATRKLEAYTVKSRGVEFMGVREITWDMKPEELTPKSGKLSVKAVKDAILKQQGGRGKK